MKSGFFMLASLLPLPLLACSSSGDIPGPGCSSTQVTLQVDFAPPMTEGSGELTQCLEKAPSLSPEGAISCFALHATRAQDGACACPPNQGLQEVSAEHESAIGKFFDSKTGILVEGRCVCEVKPLTASDAKGLMACRQEIKNPVLDSDGKAVNGYCYVDAEEASSNPEVLSHCSSNQPRAIRFVGRPATRQDDDLSVVLICLAEECGSLTE